MSSYFIFITPVAIALTVQLIKAIIDAIKGKFNFSSFYKYGGMPSGHSAFVSSTITMLWLLEGPQSPVFALAVILAIIVIRDAVSLRAHMGQHSKIINELIKKLPDDTEYSYPVLEESIGHTPMQVIAGLITGVVLSLVAYYFI